MARFCRRPSTTQQRLFVGLYPARFASSAGIAIVTGMYFAYGVPSNFFQVSSHSSTWVSASMIGIVTSPILYINVNKIVQTSRVDFENSPPYSSGLRSPSNIGRGRLNGYTLD